MKKSSLLTSTSPRALNSKRQPKKVIFGNGDGYLIITQQRPSDIPRVVPECDIYYTVRDYEGDVAGVFDCQEFVDEFSQQNNLVLHVRH